jgi:hypothetical protein
LRDNGVVTAAEFKELDRSWRRHNAKHGLDPFGRKVETPHLGTDGAVPCC